MLQDASEAPMTRQKSAAAFHTLAVDAAHWEAVLAAARDAIVCIDARGMVTLFNRVAEEIFGYRATEVLGRNVRVLMPAPYRDEHDDYLRRYRETGVARAIGRIRAVEGRRKSGEVFPMEISVAEASVGATVTYTAIIRDVTASVRAAEALRESQTRFQSFMDNSPAVAFMKDAEGRYLYVNAPFERRFGRPLAALADRTDFDVFPHETAAMLRANDSAVLAGNRPIPFHERVPTPDGVLRDWLVFKFPLADGGERRLGGIAVDITERTRAERRLAAQYAVTGTLAEASSLVDAAPALLQAIAEAAGWDLGELWLAARESRRLRWQGAWHCPAVAGDEFVAASRSLAFEPGVGLVGGVWTSGAPAWIADVSASREFLRAPAAARAGLHAACAFPILHGDEVPGVLAFFSREVRAPDDDLLRLVEALGRQIGDFIARRRSAEALRELERVAEERARLADLGAIAAKVAHDLGNPLASLAMQAELLLRRVRGGAAAPTLAASAEMIVAEARRLDRLVHDFKLIARQQRLEARPVALREVLERLVALWRPVATARGISIDLDVPRDPLPLVADEEKLRRALENLLKNAIEAIGRGPGAVTVRAEAAGRERVRISVADTGPGIPETLEVFRLFETTKPTGTGLGLPIAREVALAHGGTLEFERRAPRGTVFHLEIPSRGRSSEAEPL
jgi:PAS domain S-box-containing protein